MGSFLFISIFFINLHANDQLIADSIEVAKENAFQRVGLASQIINDHPELNLFLETRLPSPLKKSWKETINTYKRSVRGVRTKISTSNRGSAAFVPFENGKPGKVIHVLEPINDQTLLHEMGHILLNHRPEGKENECEATLVEVVIMTLTHKNPEANDYIKRCPNLNTTAGDLRQKMIDEGFNFEDVLEGKRGESIFLARKYLQQAAKDEFSIFGRDGLQCSIYKPLQKWLSLPEGDPLEYEIQDISYRGMSQRDLRLRGASDSFVLSCNPKQLELRLFMGWAWFIKSL